MTNNSSMKGRDYISQEFLTRLFQEEAVKLPTIINSKAFRKKSQLYKNIFNPNAKRSMSHIKIPEALEKRRRLDASQNSVWIEPVLYSSQVAVCCYLLRDCKFPAYNLTGEFITTLTRSMVNGFFRVHDEITAKRELSFIREAAEGVRVDRILRGFGLLSLPADEAQYLSMGAGNGVKDLNAIFSDTWLEKERIGDLNIVKFKAQHKMAMHSILVDYDVAYKDIYARLNNLYRDKVVAINNKLDAALEEIAEKVENGLFKKRNILITSRMDHVMLPDVNAFFQSLKRIITETSDLIISIGSGNNIEEFKARLEKLDEIENYLTLRGLDVYRIKICKGVTPEEMMSNPLFGDSGIAVYDILFCKIRSENLK